MKTVTSIKIERYLKRMNLNDSQIAIIKDGRYEDSKELFDYVFELADLFDELENVDAEIDRVKASENAAKIKKGDIMLRLFKLKTTTGFELGRK